jgi:Methyltransferase domain
MSEQPVHTAEEAPAPADWSRPTFTAHLRGHGPGVPPFAAREDRLTHQSSAAFAMVRAVARVPGLRRLAGAVPPGIGAHAGAPDDDALLHSRLYQRLDGLRYSPIYQKIWADRLRPVLRAGTTGASAAGGEALPGGGAAPSRLGPWVSRSVDEAIDVLRSVPFEEIQRRGWHFQPNHFYWPLNDVDFLRENMALWHDRGEPKGIDWRLDAQLELARAVHPYLEELHDVPELPDDGPARFVWQNNAFSGADAVVYYGLVRERKPRRVVEIGSGWSNLLLARALERNEPECQVTIVEPFPNESLFASLPPDWELHRAIVQQADFRLFERLEAGDICFYDGSHCVRTASDVNWFLFEILPRLQPGVLVHLHDIFFPDDYHDGWIFNEGLSWNEQYILQAFLMHNEAYRVVIANHLLWRERSDDMASLYNMDGGSIWLEKVR